MSSAPKKTELLQIRASPIFRQRLSDWRRAQPDLPGEAEAMRRLMELGFDASEAAKKKGAK